MFNLRAMANIFWTVGWISQAILQTPFLHSWNGTEGWTRHAYLITMGRKWEKIYIFEVRGGYW